MFKVRLLSGIILIILAVLFILSGGIVLASVLLVLSLIGTFEILRVFGIHKTLLGRFTYAIAMLYYVFLYFNMMEYLPEFIIVCIMGYLCIYVFRYPEYNIDSISKAMFSFFYVSFMLGFILLTREANHGVYIVWLIFLSSWGCDTCAYCVGVLFGRHKMSPVLSPKKSIEGAVGGILGTVILTYIFLTVFRDKMGFSSNTIYLISGLSAIGAFISMVGDLAASAVKRNYDIKDYGKLIPGHGGVLDRFDSVIITAPIIYILGTYFVV